MRAVSSIILLAATTTIATTTTTAHADGANAYCDDVGCCDEYGCYDFVDTNPQEPPTATHVSSAESEPSSGPSIDHTDLRVRITSGSGSWASSRSESDWYGNEMFEYHAGSIHDEMSFRLDLVGLFGERGGFYLGIGIEHARAEGTLLTEQARRSIYAAHLLAGYAKPLGKKFHLELGGLAQVGGASMRETFDGALTPSLAGIHGAFGAETSLVYVDKSGWELAITASARHDMAHVSDPHDYAVSMSGSSTAVGAFIGKRY